MTTGGRHRRCRNRLRPESEPQTSGKQAVAVGVVHEIARRNAARGEEARHDLAPKRHVVLGIGDDRGLTRRAARRVYAKDTFARDRKQAKRIVVAKRLLCGERQRGEVLERSRGIDILERLPIEGNVRSKPGDERLQTLELQAFELVPPDGFHGLIPVHNGRILVSAFRSHHCKGRGNIHSPCRKSASASSVRTGPSLAGISSTVPPPCSAPH